MYPSTYVNTFRIDNLQRPANTTAYTVGQVINSTTPRFYIFPVSQSRRGAYITRVNLVTDNPAHTAALRLWLFDQPFTAPADQTTIAWNYANGLAAEGFIDFTTFTTPGSALFTYSEGILSSNSRPIQVQSGTDNNVYGLLEVRGAFTPTSGQQFGIELYSEYSA